jgi:hypothetical protein
MAFANDDAFVWMDEPSPAVAAPPRTDIPVPPPPVTTTPSIGRLRPLAVRRESREPISWRARLTAVARSAFAGRRALLSAALELTEAVAVELRHALRAP